MNAKGLKTVLTAHVRWLGNYKEGKRADLRGMDLRGMGLRYRDLRYADFQGADLRNVNLRGTNLRGTNLRGADLRRTNLRDANLRDADLMYANLRRTNLRDADLRGADLRNTCLLGANLQNVKIDYGTAGVHPAPEGKLRAWKKIDAWIIELIIPEAARRSCATTRKCRAEYAKVISIGGKKKGKFAHRGCVYECGKVVYPDSFDDDRWNECSHGIHFFLSREEAENWDGG